MRKGQTAMEYLMTYGWAILIILIVGGLLVYYGVFSIKPGSSKQGFGLVDVSSPWSYATNGNLTVRVENRVGQSITLTQINITDPSTGAGVNGTTPYSVPLAPGQSSAFLQATGLAGGTVGDSYLIKVVIAYSVSGQVFTSTGTLGGTKS